jgi:hypothetical protein
MKENAIFKNRCFIKNQLVMSTLKINTTYSIVYCRFRSTVLSVEYYLVVILFFILLARFWSNVLSVEYYPVMAPFFI